MIDLKQHGEVCLKLVATPSQFELMLSRNVPWKLDGETRLVLAVLAQAAEDALQSYRNYLRSFVRKNEPKPKNKGAARIRRPKKVAPWRIDDLLKDEPIKFWLSGRAGDFAGLIGLDPDFVLQQFVAHMGIDLRALTETQQTDEAEHTLLAITKIYERHDALEFSL